jgi:hypothetical protein
MVGNYYQTRLRRVGASDFNCHPSPVGGLMQSQAKLMSPGESEGPRMTTQDDECTFLAPRSWK